MASQFSCNAYRNDEGDGVGRNEQAGGESREMMCAAHGSPHAGLGKRIHAVRPPLFGALAEILTQRREDGHLQPDQIRIVGAAASGHVYEVITRGVIGPDGEWKLKIKSQMLLFYWLKIKNVIYKMNYLEFYISQDEPLSVCFVKHSSSLMILMNESLSRFSCGG